MCSACVVCCDACVFFVRSIAIFNIPMQEVPFEGNFTKDKRGNITQFNVKTATVHYSEYCYAISSGGGAKPNPGIAGCGAVLLCKLGSFPQDTNDSEVVSKRAVCFVDHSVPLHGKTDIDAEAGGLVLGMTMAKEYPGLKIKHLHCYMDCKPVVKAMQNRIRMRGVRITKFIDTAKRIKESFSNLTLSWVCRRGVLQRWHRVRQMV